MGWTWRLEATDGATVDDVTVPPLPSQSDAESWLGEQWRDLAAHGVARVTLVEDGADVYGPMSLSED